MKIPAALLAPALCLAAQAAPPPVPGATIQVTATRFPEDPGKVPVAITVITGRELAERGANDLRSALALAAGVFIAPGGDGGPASSIPEFWGLKEIDAFLLVVDGVPWGGAFNPALGTLSLRDVERIEVQRGAAAVMFGATSFVGVIQVIHKAPAEASGSAELGAGSHGSASATLTLRLPRWAGFDSSLSLDHDRQGFSDPRTRFERSHLLWRNRMELADGAFHFDLDGVYLDQAPGSPHPREGKVLSAAVPLDANANPAGAYLDERRVTLGAGYDRAALGGLWSTLASVSQSRQSRFRGFLTEIASTAPNAHGYRERIDSTDLYFDSHLVWSPSAATRLVAGLDHLHGAGRGRGGDFDYFANLDGSQPPAGATLPAAADVRIDDRRDFSGLYGFAQWTPWPALVLEAGLRLNRTEESRAVATLDFASGARQAGRDAHVDTRLTGSLGGNWTFWQLGSDRLAWFGNYRNSFKPSAVDFGLDSEAGILKPETARSWDLGLKGSLLDGALALELSGFRMDFENLVLSQAVAGLPVLINAGQERFQGLEASAVLALAPALTGRLSYSYHDARFRDFVTDFDGVATQLAGRRLEMSPYHLGALGLSYAPSAGLTASGELGYTGDRFMDKRNRALTGGYTTLGATLGWRSRNWDVLIKGSNLTDQRQPVAESELGDAQYYLLPGRRLVASLHLRF